MVGCKPGAGSPSDATLAWLNQAQAKVNGNSLDSHSERVKRAAKAWGNKNNRIFEAVKKLLAMSSPGMMRCWYCEENEATVLDHFAPKSRFPHLSFRWENFVFACDQCNTHYKKDQFAVFVPPGGSESVRLVGSDDTMPPGSDDFAVIHPRLDDPMRFLRLDLKRGFFQIETVDPLSTRDQAKAKNLMEILGLNDRGGLVAKRRDVVAKFVKQLEDFEGIVEAKSLQDLARHIRFPDEIPLKMPFPKAKQKALRGLRKRILRSDHITVLYEMERQAHQIPALNRYLPALQRILE